MCGISGFYSFNNLKINKDVLTKMLRLQQHRGPDYSSTYYNGSIGLAHNRLSLLDLSSNGNQPFNNERYSLVYNGEIYNYLELKKELPPEKYISSSDTEVLFNCLKHWGIAKTLSKISGMFAFAWYDMKLDQLVIARDKIGIKPLFYGVDGEKTLWFSSEVKAIISVADFAVDDIHVLFSSVSGINEKSKYKTMWKNLFHLSPGQYIEINKKGLNKIQYYNLTDSVDEMEYNRLNKLSINEVTHEFESIFADSVKRHLASDASMGVFVSGGVDSSLIACVANEYQKDLKLFTANILGKHSEFADAKVLANHLGKELYAYDFEKSMAIRDFAKATWHYESPITTHFNAIPFSNIARVTKEQNVKAVLTGEGADELFLGYPKLLTKKYNKLINLPYKIIDYIYSKNSSLYNYVNTRNVGSQGLLDVFELGAQGFDRQIKRDNNISAYSFLDNKSQLEHYLTAQMMNEGIVSLLWRNDRMGMMYSIESRFPFIDDKVIDFALNLPVKFKIGLTSNFYNIKHPFLTDKHIVRKLGAMKLPLNLARKKKNGFPTHGLRDIRVKNQFFYNGVFANLLKLSNNQIDYMCDNSSKYNISLLASFEIWGKLFVEKRTISEVDILNKEFLSFN